MLLFVQRSFRNRQSTFKLYVSFMKFKQENIKNVLQLHKQKENSHTGQMLDEPDTDKLYFVLELLLGRAVDHYWGQVTNSTTVSFCYSSANWLAFPTFSSLFHKTKQQQKKRKTTLSVLNFVLSVVMSGLLQFSNSVLW